MTNYEFLASRVVAELNDAKNEEGYNLAMAVDVAKGEIASYMSTRNFHVNKNMYDTRMGKNGRYLVVDAVKGGNREALSVYDAYEAFTMELANFELHDGYYVAYRVGDGRALIIDANTFHALERMMNNEEWDEEFSIYGMVEELATTATQAGKNIGKLPTKDKLIVLRNIAEMLVK